MNLSWKCLKLLQVWKGINNDRICALVNKGLVHTTCDDSILVGHNIISNGKLMGCEDRDEGVCAVAWCQIGKDIFRFRKV